MLDAGGELAYGTLDSPSVTSGRRHRRRGRAAPSCLPWCCSWADAEAEPVHSLEAFGPVSSVIGYKDIPDAVRLAARGGGSLVASVCTNDPPVARELVDGDRSPPRPRAHAEPRGRAYVNRSRFAGAAPGPRRPRTCRRRRGTGRHPLGHAPHAAHRHPGLAQHAHRRDRNLAHRCRPQLHRRPRARTRSASRWRAAHRRRCALGPAAGGARGYRAFANSTGDTFYAHTNQEAAEANPFFPGIVAHGYLLLRWAAGLFVDPAPGARPGQLRAGEPALHHPGGCRATPSA